MSASSPFAGAGDKPGVTIWRIENLSPVPQPSEHAGTFFSGDSYLVLNTKSASDGSKSYDIHFWLGSETSIDEGGAAAIFATELDDSLGGKAKQYRQVQKAESPEFQELFKNGLFYKDGGVKSGFRHVEKDAAPEPALLHIKGKEHARVTEVPKSVDSLNSGDIFVLDLDATIYLWAGKDANVQEKAKAREVMMALKEARKGLPKVISLEETETGDDSAAFYAALGVDSSADVSIKPAGADTDVDDGKAFSAARLYKVEDGNGKQVAINEITESPLQKSSLEGESVFILAADGWVFIWQGSKASSAERRASLGTAQQLLQKLNLPHSTPVQLVKEGFEEPTFRQHFAGWSGSAPATPGKKTTKSKKKGSPASEAPASPSKPARTSASPKSPSAAKVATPAKAASPVKAIKAPTPAKGASPSKAATPAKEAAPSENAAESKTAQEDTPTKVEAAASSGTPADAIISPAAAANGDSVKKAAAGGESGTQDMPSSKSAGRALPKDSGFMPMPAASPALDVPVKPATDLKFTPGEDTLPYEELKEMRPEAGIDMTCKEDYLSTEEFQKVFGKSHSEFKALPKWRQIQAKKDRGLF